MRGVEDVQAYVKQGVLVVDKVGIRKTVTVVVWTGGGKLSFYAFDRRNHGFYTGNDCNETVVCVVDGNVWKNKRIRHGLENSWQMAQGLAEELDDAA